MKTCDEWLRNFNRLYNNITSNQAPGQSEYEISEFLTDAQDVVLVGLYNGTLSHSFEETEEVTDYLASLVLQADCPKVSSPAYHVVSGSQIFKLPNDLLFRTLELCTVSMDKCGEQSVIVVPVTQDEYWRTSRNPFKKQNKNRVLRLAFADKDGVSGNGYSELISDHTITKYSVRYIRKPEPIILADLGDSGLTVRGKTTAQTCQLHEFLHQAILTEAVRMAKAVWTS